MKKIIAALGIAALLSLTACNPTPPLAKEIRHIELKKEDHNG